MPMPGSPNNVTTLQAAAVVDVAEKTAKLGYFIFDPKRRKTKYASDGLKHITNRVYGGRDEVSVEDLFARVHPDDQAVVVKRVLATIENGAPLEIEFRVICNDGEILYLWMTNSQITDPDEGVIRVGIVQDLTERREREIKLRENVALKRAIIDSALDAVVIVNANGEIIDFNPTAETIFGYRKTEVIGKTLAETIIPDHHRADRTPASNAERPSGSPAAIGERVEIKALRKNGEEFPAELAMQEIHVADSVLFTATIRDISDRRAAEKLRTLHEEQLKQAKIDAEAANKAKSDFLAAMSHEIRTPLNGVLGVLTLLADTNLSDAQRQLLNTAYGSGQNLFTLISDILDISKIEAGKMEHECVDFHPVAVAEEAVGLIESAVREKGLSISIESSPDLRAIRGGQAHVRQILSNLVSNAAKFTAAGSITIRVALADMRLRYEVVDTGIGIPKDNQTRLFQKFTQLDPSNRRRYGGTGLGLSISKELAELLDGDIGCVSAEGKGSTFWFEVPVQEAAECATTSSTEDYSGADIKINARLLLAEDSNTNALVAGSFLRSAGARVDIASNGLEVLDATAARKYDLIVMDLSMPEMDGLEASETLRARGGWEAEVPILALTANASNEDREKCLRAGMNDYLTKPVEKPRLLKAVAKLLNKKPQDTAQPKHPQQTHESEEQETVFDATLIKETFGDVPGLCFEVLTAFQEELRERLTTAKQASETVDMEVLERMGHALKGAGANVHAAPISETGRTLETAAHAGDVERVKAALSKLNHLADLADEELQSLPFDRSAS